MDRSGRSRWTVFRSGAHALRLDPSPPCSPTGTHAAWSEVFPNATSIIALIDRLCHNAEIISIDADSYRNKETRDRNAARKTRRRRREP